MAAGRLFPFSASLLFSTMVDREIGKGEKNRQNQLSGHQTVFFLKNTKMCLRVRKSFFRMRRDNFWCHPKLSPGGDSFGSTQNCLLGETILSAIKNCLPRRQFWVPSKNAAHKKNFCSEKWCVTRHTEKSCARKKNVRAQEKNTVEGAGTQQLTKNNVFRKKLVYIHIRENAWCAIFAFCVDFLPFPTQMGPKEKRAKSCQTFYY